MKKYLPLIILQFLLLSKAQSQNVLTNPGFETNEAWEFRKGTLQKEVVRTGQFAIKLNSDGMKWFGIQSDAIYLPESAHKIKFTGWIKTENMSGMEGEKIMSQLGFEYLDEFDYLIGEGQVASDSSINSEWHMYTIESSPPIDVLKISVFAGLWQTKGTVYFDDFSIEILDTNNNVLPKGEKPITAEKDYSKVFSKQELISDLHQLVDNLQSHPNLYEFISEEKFNDFVKIQESKITDSMKRSDFCGIAQTIVAKVGCVHTSIYDDIPDSLPDNLFKLPISLSLFNDNLFVMENYEGNANIVAGSKITQINGVPVAIIKENLWSSISADGYNPFLKRWGLINEFNYLYNLIYGVDTQYIVQYLPPDQSTPLSTTLNIDNLKPSEETLNSKYSKNDSQLLFSINKELNTAIITIKSFSFYNSNLPYFQNFVDSCFEQINTQKIQDIVIDIRDNNGGDPHCASYLINYISENPISYYREKYSWFATQSRPATIGFSKFENKPYILVNGGEVSTSGHFCALVDYHDLGVFVGNETGSTYSCNAAQRTFRLSNTKILLDIAQNTYTVDVTDIDKSKGIIPKYIVSQNEEEFLSGKDVIMDFVFDQIRNGKKR